MQEGVGASTPSPPEPMHSNTPSFNELTPKQKISAGHAKHYCFVSDTLYTGHLVEGLQHS